MTSTTPLLYSIRAGSNVALNDLQSVGATELTTFPAPGEPFVLLVAMKRGESEDAVTRELESKNQGPWAQLTLFLYDQHGEGRTHPLGSNRATLVRDASGLWTLQTPHDSKGDAEPLPSAIARAIKAYMAGMQLATQLTVLRQRVRASVTPAGMVETMLHASNLTAVTRQASTILVDECYQHRSKQAIKEDFEKLKIHEITFDDTLLDEQRTDVVVTLNLVQVGTDGGDIRDKIKSVVADNASKYPKAMRIHVVGGVRKQDNHIYPPDAKQFAELTDAVMQQEEVAVPIFDILAWNKNPSLLRAAIDVGLRRHAAHAFEPVPPSAGVGLSAISNNVQALHITDSEVDRLMQ
jgi:hypothetical protein